MSAADNKQAAVDGYAAFGRADVESAMKQISDEIEWVVAGDNSVSGTYRGKDEVLGFWMKLAEKGFQNTPREFIADGDKVVVLVTNALNGESVDSVDVLSYDGDGNLARFEAFGETAMLDRAFPR